MLTVGKSGGAMNLLPPPRGFWKLRLHRLALLLLANEIANLDLFILSHRMQEAQKRTTGNA